MQFDRGMRLIARGADKVGAAPLPSHIERIAVYRPIGRLTLMKISLDEELGVLRTYDQEAGLKRAFAST